MSRKGRIVIAGGGMAGGKLAEELFARGRDRFDITVVRDGQVKIKVAPPRRSATEE